MTFKKLTEDEFYAQFNCVKNHIDNNAAFDGCMFETYGQEVDYIEQLLADEEKKRHIWTILEVDGKMYFSSGWHFVNRFGYLVTEEAIPMNVGFDVELDTEVDETEIHKAFFVKEITVIDPDTKGEVELTVYKHEGGGMFAMDSSFLDQCVNTDDFDRPIIPDPFSNCDVEEGLTCFVVLFD